MPAINQQTAQLVLSALGLPEAQNNLVGSINAAATSQDPHFTGAMTYGNYHLQPYEKNDGNSGTAITLDLNAGSSHKFTLTGNATISLTNPQAGGAYTIRIASGAGGFTVTWPGTVKWPEDTAPTMTVTASKTDFINLFWTGTEYLGSFVQNYNLA